MVRIIAGEKRGKNLLTPEGEHTRPSLNRVREALLNMIQMQIVDSYVLDLFAGSGAFGIECLSRGAANAFFCDNDKDAIAVIHKNLENCQYSADVFLGDYNEYLDKLASQNKRFDFIYIDPPYDSHEYTDAIRGIKVGGLLKPNGLIILESNAEIHLDGIAEIERVKKYGHVYLTFIRG